MLVFYLLDWLAFIVVSAVHYVFLSLFTLCVRKRPILEPFVYAESALLLMLFMQ